MLFRHTTLSSTKRYVDITCNSSHHESEQEARSMAQFQNSLYCAVVWRLSWPSLAKVINWDNARQRERKKSSFAPLHPGRQLSI